MARTVLLPNELERRLAGLASLRQEVNGILLYRPKGDVCPVEAILMTGVGTEGHVEAQPERVEIVNEFLRRNPDYRFIKFHTHARGTVQKYGAHYANHFSEQDVGVLEEQLRHDPAYIGMLVTQGTKVLYGRDNPQLRVVPAFPGYEKRKNAVSTALQRIAETLGYELGALKATRQ